MTETRRKIIEIIKDYMDKSLTFGCIIDDGFTYYYVGSEGRVFDRYDSYSQHCLIDEIQSIKRNIIGHYDITAISLYLKDYGCDLTIEFVDRSNIMFCISNTIKELGTIPIKPLHLYTEQEEKELLNILVSLKECDSR